VGHACRQLAAVFPEDGAEVGVGVPLVKEEWLAALDRQHHLARESVALVRSRREVPVIIEAALPGGDDTRPREEIPQGGRRRRPVSGGFVGVDAGSGPEHPGPRAGEVGCRRRSGDAGAGDDEAVNAGLGRPGQHRRQVVPEAGVG